MKRIFLIGFNKCATRSFVRFFRSQGVSSVHWQSGAVALNVSKRIEAGEDPIADYPDIQFFSDIESVRNRDVPLIEGYKWFREYHRWHPDAYFILNTRDVGSWIQSRRKHGKGNYLRHYRYHWGGVSAQEVVRRWRLDWHRHHAEVMEFFADKPRQFLLYDIDRDKPRKLTRFLARDFDLKASRFGHFGKTGLPQDTNIAA